jgi:hypothetical protein
MCITGKALILTIQARRPLGSCSSPQRPLSNSVVIITTSGGRPLPLHPSPSCTPHISPINTTDELFLGRVSTTWSILSFPVLSCPVLLLFLLSLPRINQPCCTRIQITVTIKTKDLSQERLRQSTQETHTQRPLMPKRTRATRKTIQDTGYNSTRPYTSTFIHIQHQTSLSLSSLQYV